MGKAIESTILLLSPFAPHMCEELWEKINKKTLVSQESWPKYDESLMDASLEAGEELVRSTISDISEIIKLIGKEPSKITLFTSPPWKHEVYKGVREGKEIADFMKKPELKKQGKDLVSYAQNLMKKRHELRPKLMTAEEELSALKEGSKRIGEQFSCEVKIIEALSSKHPKAKTADVAKPGIFVE
jgi:leucyl-tRNA synthetase